MHQRDKYINEHNLCYVIDCIYEKSKIVANISPTTISQPIMLIDKTTRHRWLDKGMDQYHKSV